MTDTELNIAVARARGWTLDGDLWHIPSDDPDIEMEVMFTDSYSPATDIAQAWELVEEMRQGKRIVHLDGDGSGFYFQFWSGEKRDPHDGAGADTAPRAICLAYLKVKRTVGERGRK